MPTTRATAPAAVVLPSVVVDLIGDLDVTLGDILHETLGRLADTGPTAIFVTTRHVAVSSREGLGAIVSALSAARRRGCSVSLDPGSRRMRAAFAAARIESWLPSDTRPRHARHVIIARHAQQPPFLRSA